MLRRILAAVVAAGTLTAPATAGAETFCVDTPTGCTGTQITEAQAEDAMTDFSGRSDGQADTVWFDSGTYTDPDTWAPDGDDPLTVRGAGTRTTLTSSKGAPNNIIVFNTLSTEGPVTLKDLRIVVPASFTDGGARALQLIGEDDLAERVSVVSQNAGSSGVTIAGNATFRDGSIVPAGAEGSLRDGVDFSGSGPASPLVENVSITAEHPVLAEDADLQSTVSRAVLRATGGEPVVEARLGTVNVESSLLVTAGSAGLYASSANPSPPTTVFARHVTIVNGDGGSYAPVEAELFADAEGDATVHVSDSIIGDFDVAARLVAGDEPDEGSATATFTYARIPTQQITAVGDNNVTSFTNTTDADPLFAGPDDFHLQAGSPMIDAGDPFPIGPLLDLGGNAREIDGDGDGSNQRDLGAHEFVPQPPPGDGDGGGDGDGNPQDQSQPPPGGGDEAPVQPPPPLPPGFGAETRVMFGSLTLDRRGRIVVRIRNLNIFAITGTLAAHSVGALPRAAVRLGRRSFSVAAAGRRTVRVQLSKRARRALRRRGRLRARLVATVRAPNGTSRTVRKRVRLRRPAARPG